MPILLGSAPALAPAFFGRGVGEQSCRRAAQAFAVDIHTGLHPSIWVRRQQIRHGPARGRSKHLGTTALLAIAHPNRSFAALSCWVWSVRSPSELHEFSGLSRGGCRGTKVSAQCAQELWYRWQGAECDSTPDLVRPSRKKQGAQFLDKAARAADCSSATARRAH